MLFLETRLISASYCTLFLCDCGTILGGGRGEGGEVGFLRGWELGEGEGKGET